MQALERFLSWGGVKKDIVLLAVSAISLVLSMLAPTALTFDAAWIAIILCGIPILLEAVIGLVTAFDIKADVLVSIALIASVLIGEDFAAGEIAFIMQLGALLEDLTVAKARAGIERLVQLTPRTARVIQGSSERLVPAESVQVGDLLRVLPGETIPADGVIVAGQTAVNQAVMTGESLPVDKKPGDEVASGTVNQFGSFDMRAQKVGEDSSIQRMIRLVQSADAGKAKIVGLADRWATVIVIIALSAAVLTWFISGQIVRAVTILVVFCPCALVLATPTAIMAAIGNATRHGFLIREGDALERLAGVKRFAFDKTGTLTHGRPQVVALHSVLPGLSEQELYAYAASAELRSEHPLGQAVASSYQACFPAPPPPADTFQMLPGLGVEATVSGKQVTAGNAELMRQRQIMLGEQASRAAARYLDEGCTVIYLALDGILAGFLALSDTLRPEAAETLAGIRAAGAEPVLLTGDNQQAARHAARQLAIGHVHPDCRPEDKLAYIDRLERQGEPVCMVGDGINDAPALKRAHVGIAMGGIGSDIAMDAADIVLVDDAIQQLPHLLRLAKRMMLAIRCNLSFSMALNLAAVLLAMTGALSPVAGALVHNAGSVLVILHSALLLKWQGQPSSSPASPPAPPASQAAS